MWKRMFKKNKNEAAVENKPTTPIKEDEAQPSEIRPVPQATYRFAKASCDGCGESYSADELYKCSKCDRDLCYNCVSQRQNPDKTFTNFCKCGAEVK